ncbi:MAG: hypothetical protein ABIR77_04625 [Sphingomicrobium sp.]
MNDMWLRFMAANLLVNPSFVPTPFTPGIQPPAFPTNQTAFRGLSPAEASCSRLFTREVGERLAGVPDAPSSITSARLMPAGGTHGAIDADLPEHCRVEGSISPSVGFLLRLPASG